MNILLDTGINGSKGVWWKVRVMEEEVETVERVCVVCINIFNVDLL